ncbi:uncharacterized protein M421DRAFT_426112 [Didymella exigua CBS 183.55]|uniref:Secreted protein n=1 Tax=Didymella exigua CBS 183.55 TaxID=1150837 RepID=A0A6A5RBG3_9PLEO|nr:uncharacterized protein M421DRAFT_426112 [Didymella exigua CBS 183.55]KAF1923137.1 hypothetical protein M421DRAFT_426112 [Didymella exigua CBS 183.55]
MDAVRLLYNLLSLILFLVLKKASAQRVRSGAFPDRRSKSASMAASEDSVFHISLYCIPSSILSLPSQSFSQL